MTRANSRRVCAKDILESPAIRQPSDASYDGHRLRLQARKCGATSSSASKARRGTAPSLRGQAIERGADAVVAEDAPPASFRCRWVQVTDARHLSPFLAAAFDRHPSSEMQVVGITGTNGKTTTAFLVPRSSRRRDLLCGLLGTVGYRIGTICARRPTRLRKRPKFSVCFAKWPTAAAAPWDGSGVTRAGPQPRRRHSIRRGASLRSHPRSSRLPFRHGVLLLGKAPPVRDASPGRPEPDQPRRSSRPRAHRRRGPSGTYAVNRPADISPGPLSFSSMGSVST